MKAVNILLPPPFIFLTTTRWGGLSWKKVAGPKSPRRLSSLIWDQNSESLSFWPGALTTIGIIIFNLICHKFHALVFLSSKGERATFLWAHTSQLVMPGADSTYFDFHHHHHIMLTLLSNIVMTHYNTLNTKMWTFTNTFRDHTWTI